MSSDFEQLHQALTTLEARHDKADAERLARIGDLSKQLIAAKEATEKAKANAEQQRRDKDEALSKNGLLEDQVVAARAEMARRVATLEAEAEILASRDRDSRNEIDRLRKTK